MEDKKEHHTLTLRVHHVCGKGSTQSGRIDNDFDVMRLELNDRTDGTFAYAIGPVASGHALCINAKTIDLEWVQVWRAF